MKFDNQKLRQYFLNQLSPEMAEELELELIANEDFSNELETAESDLVEDYLDNSLSAQEKELFESNYLITDARQEKLELLNSLRKFAKQSTNQPVSIEKKLSFFEILNDFFSPKKLVAFVSLFILIFSLIFVWRNISSENNVNSEIAVINKKDLSNLDEFKDIKNLSLISGNVRSGGNGNVLSENDLTNQVLLRLALPNQTGNKDFTVIISKDRQEKQKFTQRIYGQEVRLLIPKSMLGKGEFQIMLEKDSEKYNYYFEVR